MYTMLEVIEVTSAQCCSLVRRSMETKMVPREREGIDMDLLSNIGMNKHLSTKVANKVNFR